jgi:hypothetical protein
MEVVRRRRLGRGEPHAAVERALGDGGDLVRLAALALFDDAARAGEVGTRLQRDAGAPLADALTRCAGGADEAGATDPVELVRRSSKLAAWLRGLA